MARWKTAYPTVSRQQRYQQGFARWASGEDDKYSKYLWEHGTNAVDFPRYKWYAVLRAQEKANELPTAIIAVALFLFCIYFTGGIH